MAYTDEQMERYSKIINNYTRKKEEDNRFKCWNCQSDSFYVESGFYYCESCQSSDGHAVGYFDLKEYDRFHYRRKSIYHRKYHYEKIVKNISKNLPLTDEFNRLLEIDQDTITKLNNQFCRKRMISIYYLVKKCLEEMGCEKYKQVRIKISKQILENYEKWWESYKSLNNFFMKEPINNPS